MATRSYNISDKAADNLIRAAKAAKRNASKHLEFLLENLNKKETKDGKRSQKTGD